MNYATLRLAEEERYIRNMGPSFTITPLGAAVVEAMPNDRLVRTIKRDFARQGVCPVSALFNTRGVVQFYLDQGKTIKAVATKET